MLPKEPAMLLSVVNSKLRDHYESLEALCEDTRADMSLIKERIARIGYHYDREKNQFV